MSCAERNGGALTLPDPSLRLPTVRQVQSFL